MLVLVEAALMVFGCGRLFYWRLVAVGAGATI